MQRSAILALAVLVSGTPGLLSAGIAGAAENRGGLYGFDALVEQPHPFANVPSGFDMPPAPIPQAAPYVPPVSQPVMRPVAQPAVQPAPIAPPPPPPGTTAVPPPPAAQPTVQAQAQTAPPPPPAQPRQSGGGGLTSGLYFSIIGGWDQPKDLGGTTSSGQSFNTEVDSGFLLGIALGRTIGRNWRGEFEIGYRSADYKSTTVGGTQASGGSLESTALMLNGYYGFDLGGPVVPYLGAGIGAAFIDGSGGSVAGDTVPGRNATEFGYQAMLGADWLFGNRYAVGLQGRYFGTTDSDVQSTTLALVARFHL